MVEFGVPSDMSDALSVIPDAVHRNLSDELYVKRKNAVLDLEYIAKSLTCAGDYDKISKVIEMLIEEFAKSPKAAVTTGLSSVAAQQYLEQILPLVINSFSDQDSRVRYYACEALYNIAKDGTLFLTDTDMHEHLPNFLDEYPQQNVYSLVQIMQSFNEWLAL